MKGNFCNACGRVLIGQLDLSVRCRLCLRNYHAHCWEKTGGCITWGCAAKNTQHQPPVNYKRCPSCSEEIPDFAACCPYCRFHLEKPEIIASPPKSKFYTKRKDPVLTCLLNLIFPGAGYMYLGYFFKGIIWLLVTLVAFIFARAWGLLASYSWIMFDSTRIAIKDNRKPTSKTKNRSL